MELPGGSFRKGAWGVFGGGASSTLDRVATVLLQQIAGLILRNSKIVRSQKWTLLDCSQV